MLRLARLLLGAASLFADWELECDWRSDAWRIDAAIDGFHPAAGAEVCGVATKVHNPHWLRLSPRTWGGTIVGGEARWNWELGRWEIKSIHYVK